MRTSAYLENRPAEIRSPYATLSGTGGAKKRPGAFDTGPVGEGCADTATVEIDHATLLMAGEDDTSAKGVPALVVDQCHLHSKSWE